MMVLPPLNEDIADKLILLRASRFDFPNPINSTEEKERFEGMIRAEIPAFLHWLINKYQIPTAYADPRRYNIATFHHPALKQNLDGLSPESKFLELIDLTYPNGLSSQPAEEIQSQIFKEHAFQAQRLFSFLDSCGRYLARLQKKYPARIQSRHTMRGNVWTVLPRANEPNESNE